MYTVYCIYFHIVSSYKSVIVCTYLLLICIMFSIQWETAFKNFYTMTSEYGILVVIAGISCNSIGSCYFKRPVGKKWRDTFISGTLSNKMLSFTISAIQSVKSMVLLGNIRLFYSIYPIICIKYDFLIYSKNSLSEESRK